MSKDMTEDFFDLTEFDANLRIQEEGISVKIMGPNGKATGLEWVVCGPDSSRAQKATSEVRAMIEAEAAKEGNDDIDSPEARRRREMIYLAKLTKGWNKPIGADRLTYSEENAIAILSKYPLIEAQVRFAADRRSVFTES